MRGNSRELSRVSCEEAMFLKSSEFSTAELIRGLLEDLLLRPYLGL